MRVCAFYVLWRLGLVASVGCAWWLAYNVASGHGLVRAAPLYVGKDDEDAWHTAIMAALGRWRLPTS
ncbi:hypothetical protein XarbCFBP8138_08815 [Xanthomonas arboricola]|nr:hypothetical protein XarbCFBP8138_08815 [Xanthomonas arboricola]